MSSSTKREKKVKRKPINWSKAFKKAIEQEHEVDALRAIELIRELYYLTIIKHGKK